MAKGDILLVNCSDEVGNIEEHSEKLSTESREALMSGVDDKEPRTAGGVLPGVRRTVNCR